MLFFAIALSAGSVSAGQREFIFSGSDYLLALGFARVNINAEAGRLGISTRRDEQGTILRYKVDEGKKTVYRSTSDFPMCSVWGGEEDLVLISDRDSRGQECLVVTDYVGAEKGRILLSSTSLQRTGTFGWAGSSMRVFYSEEIDGDPKELCRPSRGIYLYDLTNATTLNISKTARRASWSDVKKAILLSDSCHDCSATIEAYDPTRQKVGRTDLCGMSFSKNSGYYAGYCDNENWLTLYESNTNRSYLPGVAVLRNRGIRAWLQGDIAVIYTRIMKTGEPDSVKHDYLYSPAENKVQRIPGCYVAQCRDPKYILIVAHPEGALREFCLDDAETIEPKDLPYYEEPKETPAPPQPK